MPDLYSDLAARSNNHCELCQHNGELLAFYVDEAEDTSVHSHVHICETCHANIAARDELDLLHLRCLSNSMWSTTPAVQVLSYRLLHACLPETWAQDALDMLYLEDDVRRWADAGLAKSKVEQKPATLDVNGVALQAGDTVTIIKDLDVKGANFTAKRGTPVRNIGLSENPLHIEGRVNGQRIVIIAAYTKKN